jgi:hypothetical protein
LSHNLDLASNFDTIILTVGKVFDHLDGNHLLSTAALAKLDQSKGALSKEFDQFVIFFEVHPNIGEGSLSLKANFALLGLRAQETVGGRLRHLYTGTIS